MKGSGFNYGAIGVAAASWGTWSVFLRGAQAERPLPPSLCTFVVLAAIALVLLPLALVERRRAPERGKRDWLLLAAFGVSDALNCSLYFAALQSTSVTVATLTHYLAPLLVALAAPMILRETRRPGTGLAIAVALLGLVVLLGGRAASRVSLRRFRGLFGAPPARSFLLRGCCSTSTFRSASGRPS